LSETSEHRELKALFEAKLREWFGLSITEYPSSGHELDIIGMTHDGVKIYVEIVWSHSRTHFFQDMNMLQQSDAEVKVVVASPQIIKDAYMLREFTKVAVTQAEKGQCIHPEIIDGERLLSDSNYVDRQVKGVFTSLVDKVRQKPGHKKEVRIPSRKEEFNRQTAWAGDLEATLGRFIRVWQSFEEDESESKFNYLSNVLTIALHAADNMRLLQSKYELAMGAELDAEVTSLTNLLQRLGTSYSGFLDASIADSILRLGNEAYKLANAVLRSAYLKIGKLSE
jgi:hypothetical protein